MLFGVKSAHAQLRSESISSWGLFPGFFLFVICWELLVLWDALFTNPPFKNANLCLCHILPTTTLKPTFKHKTERRRKQIHPGLWGLQFLCVKREPFAPFGVVAPLGCTAASTLLPKALLGIRMTEKNEAGGRDENVAGRLDFFFLLFLADLQSCPFWYPSVGTEFRSEDTKAKRQNIKLTHQWLGGTKIPGYLL